MYADFDYYKTEYGGAVLESADVFKPYERKAERRVDAVTAGKLTFAFPTEERQAQAVKDCICELTEFLYQVDTYRREAMSGMGTVKLEDGTVQGKVLTSVSSGSESRSYSATNSVATIVTDAARDMKVFDTAVYAIMKNGLSGISDANGVLLLYAGKYPGRECVWE